MKLSELQPPVRFHRFSTPEALAETLSDDVAHELAEAIANRHLATLVVSGGTTPVPFFHALCDQPLDWARLYVTLADERWVPADHEDSNEKLVRDHLLVPGTMFVGLKNKADTPEKGLAQTAVGISHLPQPFDLIMLGMGEDGHTASLFPGGHMIQEAMDPDYPNSYVAMRSPNLAHPRISMTLGALLRSRHIILLITGEKKLEVIEKAQAEDCRERLPVSALLHQHRVPVDVYWSP